jgi:hypothetical protein
MRFTEEKLEKEFTELFGQEGFFHHLALPFSLNLRRHLWENEEYVGMLSFATKLRS